MRRLLLALALVAALVPPLPAWAALALDGSAHANHTGTSSTATLTTSSTNDVIVVFIVANVSAINSVTDTAGLSWSQRATTTDGSGNWIFEWTAISAGALSSDVITVTPSASTFTTIDAFGISGANTVTPFDSNVGLPATGAPTLTLSTSNANDFIVAGMITSGTVTAGGSWTLISGADFQGVEYQIVAATQSGLSVTVGTGSYTRAIGDAIVAGGGGGVTCGARALLGVGC